MDNCYDFPLLVIHASEGTCSRYNGGVCHPFATPTPPYKTVEEAEAVALYQEALQFGIPAVKVFHAPGTTGETKPRA